MSIEHLERIDGVAQYDLIVIGSGSGNTLIGPEWDDKKVALVDGGIFGGTCLNVGCIPTKMFVYPATIAQKTREVKHLGVDAHVDACWVLIRSLIFVLGGLLASVACGRANRYWEGIRIFSAARSLALAAREFCAISSSVGGSAPRVIILIVGLCSSSSTGNPFGALEVASAVRARFTILSSRLW